MKMLGSLIQWCSAKVRLALVKADLIPQLIITLNPQSLSFAEAGDIHVYLLNIVGNCVLLATPQGLEELKIEDENEQQAVHETVLKHVFAPSKQYIRHLCVNRHSMIDDDLPNAFMTLLVRNLRVSPYYHPTMDIVENMPIVITIPSCLAFIEDDCSIFIFLDEVIEAQREWNKKGGDVQHLGKKEHRMLRMEGFEDVTEQKLLNDEDIYDRRIVVLSSDLNNRQGMNLPYRGLKSQTT
ncbi:hypothetical protein BLNAU_8493 [Blattamonas nauphoetae]|uniref:Uncharacterized protein n=1 Tax=Blattamonas nauphoetae TaxID=2049346 RepID=A0ABQ9XYT4_9EUKA|nr:hypothetical protein BLNAU_8493 [Blattamonas nauphoetae]